MDVPSWTSYRWGTTTSRIWDSVSMGFRWSSLPAKMTEICIWVCVEDHVGCLFGCYSNLSNCRNYDGTLILTYLETYLRAHQYHPHTKETNRLLEAVPKLAMSLHGCLPRKWSKRNSHIQSPFPAQSWWWIFFCFPVCEWYRGFVACYVPLLSVYR